MDNETPQIHILLKKSHVHPVVIVVGDPKRCELYASMCDASKIIVSNREYTTYEGRVKDNHLTLISHGIGGPGAAICFEEIISCGAKLIIRLGTCGSLQPEKHVVGDLISVQAGVKEDGMANHLTPKTYPACSDVDVMSVLANGAKNLKVPLKGNGIALGSALYYYKTPYVKHDVELWRKLKVDVIEMEYPALAVLARINEVKCGCLLAVDGSPFTHHIEPPKHRSEILTTSIKKMFSIVCAALPELYSLVSIESDNNLSESI